MKGLENGGRLCRGVTARTASGAYSRGRPHKVVALLSLLEHHLLSEGNPPQPQHRFVTGGSVPGGAEAQTDSASTSN